MAVNVKKYNPGFLTDDELVSKFCVRLPEFESIVETLRDSAASSNIHSIVIGPRGSGKTHLVLRVAAEVRQDTSLGGLFPIVFGEESYEIGTAGEFWLECLGHLAEQAPPEERDDLRLSYRDLMSIPLGDDHVLADRCLASLLDFADRRGQRLLLIVENLDMLFGEMMDDHTGWRLRKTLQTEPRVILLASATSRFAELDDPGKALYDLFRVIPLSPLDTHGCQVLWSQVSGQPKRAMLMRPLEILTGGSPRLITVIGGFEEAHSFRELMGNLLDLVDEHTEYFKSHLDALPHQERRIYLALARLWKPATAREVARLARVDVHKCSSQLKRLVDRGAVAIEGGTPRRRQYYLTERMYNIYYLLRRPSGEREMVETLIRFMASFYSIDDLVNIGVGMVRDRDDSDRRFRELQHWAFMALVELLDVSSLEVATPVASALLDEANALVWEGRHQDALYVYDQVIQRFGGHASSEAVHSSSVALVRKGILLWRTGRRDEGLSCYKAGIELIASSVGTSPNRMLDVMATEDIQASDWVAAFLETYALLMAKLPYLAWDALNEPLIKESPVENANDNLAKLVLIVVKSKLMAIDGLTITESEATALLSNPEFLINGPVESQGMTSLLHFFAGTTPDKALEILESSPAATSLQPIAVALQQDLGLETAIAIEVNEVAQDIRSGIAKIRSALEASARSPALGLGSPEKSIPLC